MAKKICAICGKEMGAMTGKVKCLDGYICADCFKSLGYSTMDANALTTAGNMTTAQLAAMGEKKTSDVGVINDFQPTSKTAEYAQFDDNNRQMILSNKVHALYKPEHFTLFSYDQLVDYELLEDGNSIVSGGLGRAVAGGLLFGGVGAIVGGATGKKKSKGTCTQLRIKLTVKDYQEPAFYIDVITAETKKGGLLWNSTMKEVENTLAKFQLITDSMSETNAECTDSRPVVDTAEEIRKFKALLDDGIITQEEFDAKKKELLMS